MTTDVDTDEDTFFINVDKKNKLVQFTGDISEKSVHNLKESILEVVNALKKSDIRMINLHISSDGGCLFSGVGMYDWIILMKSTLDWKLTCYGQGLVASSASVIFMSGDVRVCGPNSYFLIHALSSGGLSILTGFEDMKQNMKNNQILMDQLIRFYKQNTTITDKMLNKCMKKDIYMTHEKCVLHGIDNTQSKQ